MKNTRLLQLVLMAAVALSLGITLGGGKAWKVLAANDAVFTPFTVELTHRTVDESGSERRHSTRTVARRSDGSMSVREHRFFKSEGKERNLPFTDIQDVTARRLVSIHPSISAQTTARLPDSARAQLTTKPSGTCQTTRDNATIQSTARQVILGHKVVARTLSVPRTTNGGGTVDVTEWAAPDLDCFVLRKESKVVGADGTVKSSSVTEAVSVVLGEPATEYFSVPPGLTEMTPSEVIRAQAKLDGRECKACEQGVMEHSDRFYQANRPK